MTIRILSPQLASQIAAGEVVERPASVIKELVENSIDAAATQIDIDINKGGMQLLRVRDNGCGVSRKELALALRRHATSKISCIDDLSTIATLGFRGEALASISSVSRLTFTSKPANQDDAWQAFVEGQNSEVRLRPASHSGGSTIEVQDLFYNTPARRRFLKTEKTEFGHINAMIKKIALSHPQIDFRITNNGNLVQTYRHAANEEQLGKRIGAICGQEFMTNAFKIEWHHEDIGIRGWLNPNVKKEVAYFYVNQRAVRDPLITHAIKQALAEQVNNKPGYILYLTLNPKDVDVNVHPTKQEVRFHEARLIHDFICQAVQMVMSTSCIKIEAQLPHRAAGITIFDSAKLVTTAKDNPSCAKEESRPLMPLVPVLSRAYAKPITTKKSFCELSLSADMEQWTVSSLGKVITLWEQNYVIVYEKGHLYLVSLEKAEQILYTFTLKEQAKKPLQKLLIPLRLVLDTDEQILWKENLLLLINLNIHAQLQDGHLQLNGVPTLLRNLDLQTLIRRLGNYLSQLQHREEITAEKIIAWLANYYCQYNHRQKRQACWRHTQAVMLLTQLEQFKLSLTQRQSFMERIDLSAPLAVLQSR